MFFLYTLIIKSYGLCIAIASLAHPKAKQLVHGRRAQTVLIKEQLEAWGNQKRIWIHAASYGEYEMARPIVEELAKNPDLNFIVSFHSPSGYEQHHFNDSRYLKIYLPLDTSSKQAEMLDLIKPDKVVFIKYEFWFNLLRELAKREIPYYYTSLHLNNNSYLFNPLFSPFLNLIKKSKAIFCHNEGSLQTLNEKGFRNALILGDTRIKQSLHIKEINNYKFTWSDNESLSIALGSIIPSEYATVAHLINSQPTKNFLLAPHDIDIENISKLKALIDGHVSLYSEQKQPFQRILIVDTIGDLKFLYKFCDIAYVGAGFEKGPHNVLESLVYGLPTVCGPNIKKFPMAQLLSAKGLLRIAEKKSDLAEIMSELSESNLEEFESLTSSFFQEYPDNLERLINELSS